MLSSSSKYALRALICLADDCNGSFIRVDQLSEKAEVPGPYLSKIMKLLAKKKIVETRRGLAGGVRLSTKIRSLSFHDVCVALDDPIVTYSCILTRSKCGGRSPCALHKEWGKTRERVHSFLKRACIV